MHYNNTALDAYRVELAKPIAEDHYQQCDETFDPWEPLGCLYGSYSDDFDDMALLVLENLQAREFGGEGLAHQMFREILCKIDLCEYGSSPRVCFPRSEFRDMLPGLIAKWREYCAMQWADA